MERYTWWREAQKRTWRDAVTELWTRTFQRQQGSGQRAFAHNQQFTRPARQSRHDRTTRANAEAASVDQADLSLRPTCRSVSRKAERGDCFPPGPKPPPSFLGHLRQMLIVCVQPFGSMLMDPGARLLSAARFPMETQYTGEQAD